MLWLLLQQQWIMLMLLPLLLLCNERMLSLQLRPLLMSSHSVLLLRQLLLLQPWVCWWLRLWCRIELESSTAAVRTGCIRGEGSYALQQLIRSLWRLPCPCPCCCWCACCCCCSSWRSVDMRRRCIMARCRLAAWCVRLPVSFRAAGAATRVGACACAWLVRLVVCTLSVVLDASLVRALTTAPAGGREGRTAADRRNGKRKAGTRHNVLEPSNLTDVLLLFDTMCATGGWFEASTSEQELQAARISRRCAG